MAEITRRSFLEGAAVLGAAISLDLLPKAHADESLLPFAVHVPQGELVALKARVAATRWPEQETVADASQGIQLARLQALANFWKSPLGYDWRDCEARINAVPNYIAQIDGIDIHFIWRPSSNPNAIPLLLTHGWPGSFMEFLGAIEPLADPLNHGGNASDAFHVVCPSIPGFGFSGKPTSPGWNPFVVAQAWAKLMTRLGYERFGVQGGDWGAVISTLLAWLYPQRVIGMHTNFALQAMRYDPNDAVTPEEQAAQADAGFFAEWGMGYAAEQATRPQTIGYALVDSPVGLCGWIAEKCYAWAGPGPTPGSILLSPTQILDQVTLYWLTATGASAARLYWEGDFGRPSGASQQLPPLAVPVAVSVFPGEFQRPSERWCQLAFGNMLRYYHHAATGGHFAAWEQPEVFADEVRAGFRAIRGS